MEISPKTKTCIFQNLDFSNGNPIFPKLIQIQKHDIETTFRHDVYGYNPIYMKHIYIHVFDFKYKNTFC